MDEKQPFYDPPVAEVIKVNAEACILQDSVRATRQSYGTALTDEWD